MKSFKSWLEDYDPRDDIPGGSYKFEVGEIDLRDEPIPGLPQPTHTGENEVYQVVYDLGYTMTPGMKGHTSKADFGVQMQPDDPDKYKITHNDPIEVNHEKLDGNHPILKTFHITLDKLKEILIKYFNDYLHEEALGEVEDHH